jgi:hypothetical protein
MPWLYQVLLFYHRSAWSPNGTALQGNRILICASEIASQGRSAPAVHPPTQNVSARTGVLASSPTFRVDR